MSTVEQRVRSGATLLDMSVPGWASKIDRDTLNLQLCTACVLGQLYSDYAKGCEALDLSEDQVIAFGFEHSMNWRGLSRTETESRQDEVAAEYKALTACWLAEHAARLGEGEDETIDEDATEAEKAAWAGMPL